MALTETVEVTLPIELFEDLRDEELQRIGNREFTNRRGGNNHPDTYASNGPMGQILLEVLLGERDDLSEKWNNGKPLEPTPEGTVETRQPRDNAGNFAPKED